MKKTLILLMLCSVVLSAFEGEKAYKSCAMCHGKDAKRRAHKKSAVIASFSEEELTRRLQALIDGSSTMPRQFLNLHKTKLKSAGINRDNAGDLSHHILNLK